MAKAESHRPKQEPAILRRVLFVRASRGLLAAPSFHAQPRIIDMASKTETDIEVLADELNDLRSQIAKVADRLSDTAAHAGQDASNVGRRAWATLQDEAEPYIRQIEDHPVTSTAFVFGALGLFLGLLFARRV
jgi:ElaB/YqjD/DUF883 family membrane-anchored ribosome-binding protein